MYIWLANRIVVTGRESLEAGESPNMAAMGWSALAGFIAGLVGAAVASGFHLIMLHIFPYYNLLQVRPALRALFAFRSIVILVVYPMVGILVCGFAGLMFGNDLHRASRFDQDAER